MTIDDFIVYDSYYNHRRSRNPDKADDNHWAPIECKNPKPYSDRWYLCQCLYHIGGVSEAARIVSMYQRGVPIQRIQELYHLSSPSCIYRILEYYGITPNRQRRRNGRRRLTEEELKLIVEMYRAGASIYEIAKRLNRSPYLITYHLRRLGLR